MNREATVLLNCLGEVLHCFKYSCYCCHSYDSLGSYLGCKFSLFVVIIGQKEPSPLCVCVCERESLVIFKIICMPLFCACACVHTCPGVHILTGQGYQDGLMGASELPNVVLGIELQSWRSSTCS